MNITAALRAFFESKGWIQTGVTNEVVQQEVTKRLIAGELSADQLAELTKAAPAPGQTLVANLVNAEVTKALAPFAETLKSISDRLAMPAPAVQAPVPVAAGVVGGSDGGQVDPAKAIGSAAAVAGGGLSPVCHLEVFDNSRKAIIFPTKSASGAAHPLANQPVTFCGRMIDSTSDRAKAIAGAWWKFVLLRNNKGQAISPAYSLTEFDRKTIEWAMHNCTFIGGISVRSNPDEAHDFVVNRRKLTELEIKTLLDDNTSGGIEITPYEFDDAIVVTPLLSGELFPYVTVREVARGRRMKGGSIGTLTFASTAEGTAITPFTTDAFVAAFDTTIFPAVGAVEIGRDFMEDSPVAIGQYLIAQYGEAAKAWLDRVIAVGNGTSEPQGVLNASGVSLIVSDNNVNGPLTVGDLEGLKFGVAKQYRNGKGGKNIFLTNDTTYSRFRGIPVGPNDQRRIFGLTNADYMAMGDPWKVQNDLTNSQAAYVNLGYYRMYRRLGMTVKIENTGRTLALSNSDMIAVRMRWGGKMELAGAAAVSATLQA